jgi:hypothetical protein
MLIVRVWREDDAFRASVSSTPDIMSSQPSEHTSAGAPGEVLRLVEEWLRSI